LGDALSVHESVCYPRWLTGMEANILSYLPTTERQVLVRRIMLMVTAALVRTNA
jgi:hypothetical protein